MKIKAKKEKMERKDKLSGKPQAKGARSVSKGKQEKGARSLPKAKQEKGERGG